MTNNCTSIVAQGNFGSGQSFLQTTQSIISLQIPISFELEFIKESIFLRIGGFFQSPIFTELESFLTDFRNRAVTNSIGEEEIICTFTSYKDKDHSGEGFSNIQFGLHAGIRYQLFKKLSLIVDFQNGFNSIYNKKTLQKYGQAKLTTLSLKLRYYLSKKNKISN